MKLLLSATLPLFLLAAVRILAADAPATPASGTITANSTAVLPPPATDFVVAKGRSFEIKRSAMDQVLATAKAKYPNEPLPADADVRVINQLIEMQLVLQRATPAEIADGKKNAGDRVAAILKSLGPAEFAHRLQATLMTADDLRLTLAQEDTAQISLTRQLNIQVTDADAKKFFDDHPGAYDQPVMAHVRELLLLTTSDFTTSAAPRLPEAMIQTKHQLMDSLHKRILAGEDFAALAKQYNEDPISKGTGGELNFRRDQMSYGDLALSMKPGQFSEVLTDEDGFRIFQLLDIIPAKKADFTALDQQIKNMLVGVQKRTAAPAYIKQLWKDSNVEILDAKLKTAMAAAAAEAEATAQANAAAQAKAEADAKAAAANPPPAKP